MSKKFYLCGKMTGLPKFGFDIFDKAAMELREKDYEIISPAELDDPLHRKEFMESTDGQLLPHHPTWGDLLSRDLKILADGNLDGIICLPGWETSKGARLETYIVNELLGKPVYEYQNKILVWLTRAQLTKVWIA